MEQFDAYYTILNEELVTATGCTEPIALAFVSAMARKVLEKDPTKIIAYCSANVVKNVKSVTIPNTNNNRGIMTAVNAGWIAGDADKELEVISIVSDEQKQRIEEISKTNLVEVVCLKDEPNLSIRIQMFSDEDEVNVTLYHTHTNITKVEKNKEILYEKSCDLDNFNASLTDRSVLNLKGIQEFATNCKLERISDLLEKQIEINMAIANEGIKNGYGACVGKTILENIPGNYSSCIAMTAAASDARMSGCQLPVMTNSGSGNQGITTSVPVIVYAQEHNIDHEKLLRALVLANLCTIHFKTGIGRLSAYCGVVCAAVASFAGIAYINDESLCVIEDLITNGLATASGMICDGAKESCASKISTALFSAMLGYEMARSKRVFKDECGIVQDCVEHTIKVVGTLGHEGMRQTDNMILDIMTKNKIAD
ncbi:MAG: L-serine ammonia-lyase, iron-sulfur-dependent, subunit alpha [Anaerorhabdus sp.]|uniref:Serine dehydratase-like alpha subunit domain-containing protein n=2 Tax=root TaxID=1 RepID=A0A645CEP0_9ZZZZ|nr:L-serine ammonia-lyase, iron-sulfur-dependent, subunit alpha [Anaerorhabdus sp.]MEA4875357.1 L-serine ammonia-lyase, iron-sulfur-dependent, subunit alpha [Anaerorhabdus sp.]